MSKCPDNCVECAQCKVQYDPAFCYEACPHHMRTSAQEAPNQSILNLAVGNRLKIEALEKRLERVERELAVADRILTEIRRERALRSELPAT